MSLARKTKASEEAGRDAVITISNSTLRESRGATPSVSELGGTLAASVVKVAEREGVELIRFEGHALLQGAFRSPFGKRGVVKEGFVGQQRVRIKLWTNDSVSNTVIERMVNMDLTAGSADYVAMLNHNPVPERISLGKLLLALIAENRELRAGAIPEPVIRLSAGDSCLGHPGPRRRRSLCTKFIQFTNPAGFELPKSNWEPRIVPV